MSFIFSWYVVQGLELSRVMLTVARFHVLLKLAISDFGTISKEHCSWWTGTLSCRDGIFGDDTQLSPNGRNIPSPESVNRDN